MSAARTLDLSLTLVTDAALCGERGVAAVVAAAVAGGVTTVQLRDKQAGHDELLRELEAVAEAVAGRATLLVNDRLDVVLAARARGIRVDGVHLGQGDASVLAAREALGPDAMIGLTANTPEHVEAVARMPRGTVDYLGVGVIRPTSTKPDHPPALGVDGFARIAGLAAEIGLPCVAIGGVGAADAAGLREAGAAGVAVVSAVCAAGDPEGAAREIVRAWGAGLDTRPPPSGATRPAEIWGLDTRPPSSGATRPAGGAGAARPAGVRVPRVLSVAGSDPSGGAGIQADLKAIAAVGGYGMAVITALTAQNTHGVRAVHVPPVEFLRAQLDAISDDIAIDAVKLGMLANAEVIREVAEWLTHTRPPVVVLDPVMVATSGDRLLDADAEQAMRELLPLADLVTPNLAELAVLAEAAPASTWSEALDQAAALSSRYGVRVLAKGGHLGGDSAPDALVDARLHRAPNAPATSATPPAGRRDASVHEYPGDRIATTATHGTGCSLSSAIATLRVTRGSWHPAVADARTWLRESLRHGESLAVGSGSGPVHHFAGLWQRGGLVTAPTPDEVEADWWAEVAEVRRGIDELPFILGLADGTLARADFEYYLAQDAIYLGEYSRVLAAASTLAPDATEQAFWARGAHQCIAVEAELHREWLTGASAALDDRGPVTTAYLDHLLATTARGDYAVLAAAALPCYWLYDDLGRRLADGSFGEQTAAPGHPYADWLTQYGDPAFAEATREAIRIVTGLASRATPELRERMLRAFRISAEHELAFFAAPIARAEAAA
ncbi:bifunctional hydroxymethylpyrimidine kinase/phosphomethylpyrimidine kinase [Agromyces subbeticus]|uniref:bifunctional hydroxymethylpyrimidine kinase/phosphomethylpyrimidine kinase n=1 Tax=Agromyces subbeticus TaxID=293890 RepID=UPI0003B59A94|nr:bifunctional hydroxymethylpyrimidine kinase/phosphomethylpyrimidine kinase [Agromyces subbeticus]